MTAIATGSPQLLKPESVEEAQHALRGLGADGAPIAGGTWIMRAHLRGERHRLTYVALGGLQELRGVETAQEARIGALVTHAELAALDGALAALGEAARLSAFPAVRNVATIGGNVCARPFPEADLLPALLALNARIQVSAAAAQNGVPLADYLETRQQRPAGELVVAVRIPMLAGRRSSFERLTVRSSGEYALASVAAAVDVDPSRRIVRARVAVGSVEPVTRRWRSAEEALAGKPLEPALAEVAGSVDTSELAAREGIDAPAWYRLAVLPVLLRRVVGKLAAESSREGER